MNHYTQGGNGLDKNIQKILRTQRQKELDMIYHLAITGDKNAQKILRDKFGYVVITVNGELINLKELK